MYYLSILTIDKLTKISANTLMTLEVHTCMYQFYKFDVSKLNGPLKVHFRVEHCARLNLVGKFFCFSSCRR
jgi:hypothetical protein